MKRSGRPVTKTKPDENTLLKEYEFMTAKELSKKYGVKEVTIRSWVQAARKNTGSAGGKEKQLQDLLVHIRQVQQDIGEMTGERGEELPQEFFKDLDSLNKACERMASDIKSAFENTGTDK